MRALLALWAAAGCVARVPDPCLAPEQTAQAVVAARELSPGVEVRPEDLWVVTVPVAYLPQTWFGDVDDVVGRRPVARILANEFVRPQRLDDATDASRPAGRIPLGMRVVSLTVPRGAAGALTAGTYVDVLDAGGQVLAPAAYVFGAPVAQDDDAWSWLSVVVSPAQGVAIASTPDADLTLAVRNSLDLGWAETPP